MLKFQNNSSRIRKVISDNGCGWEAFLTSFNKFERAISRAFVITIELWHLFYNFLVRWYLNVPGFETILQGQKVTSEMHLDGTISCIRKGPSKGVQNA